VWSVPGTCPHGSGVYVARIDPATDAPQKPAYAHTPSGRKLLLHPTLAVAPAPHGEIAIAGSASKPEQADGQLVQGEVGGPFAPLGPLVGEVTVGSLATGYLGDLAAFSPSAGSRAGAGVLVERYFARALSPPRAVPAHKGRAEFGTVSLDFRSDAIAVWRQGGALLARDLPASGRPQPTQRLRGVSRAPRVAALISDNNRAIVAWADLGEHTTSIYLDYSGPGVRFGRPRLLERFEDPEGTYPPLSPRLIRLSSESVMLAWTGAEHGHWVVRSAAIDLHGIGKASMISAPGTDALLNDLEPGPSGEALAIWSEPRREADGSLSQRERAIVAARGIDTQPDATIFGAPEQVAPPGPNSLPTVAIDPDSGRALALWLGGGDRVYYALRTPAG
jgi:hypothetical protein